MSWSFRMCVLVALACAACTKEKWVEPTQVIITLHSDDDRDLTSVVASVYDVLGEQRGGEHVFKLQGDLRLPLSFTVIPGQPDTEQFLVVLSGRDADDTELMQTRALIKFVRQDSVGVHLWLYAGCRNRTCGEGETCTVTSDENVVGCTSIPTLEGTRVTPGQELDSGLEALDARASDAESSDVPERSEASMSPASDSSVGSGSDSSATPDGASPDEAGQPDATLDGPCVGSAGQPACMGSVLYRCDSQGKPTGQETCVSPRACQLGLAQSTCAKCDPGVFRCVGARLERCGEDGFVWSEIKTCDSEALCNVQAGDCTTGACTAATRTCMGDDLYGCSDDLTRLVLRAECDPNMCDPAQGQCDVCVANSRSCASDSVVACDKDGQNLSTTPCPVATPKCTGSGQCVQCTSAAHCTAPSSQCQTATCSGSPPRCGVMNKSAHQPCVGGVCNGSGTCIGCVDDSDCTAANARKCSSNQRCVQCKSSADCAQGYECRVSDNTCQRISVAGMATGCQSYTPATSSKCGGWYCNLAPQQLTAAFDPTGVCGGLASTVCSERLPVAVGKCARDVKAANIAANDEELRPKIEECIRKADQLYAAISPQCLGCYINVQECAAQKCLIECIAGDSVNCDACRLQKNCDQPLPGCGGLPNTF